MRQSSTKPVWTVNAGPKMLTRSGRSRPEHMTQFWHCTATPAGRAAQDLGCAWSDGAAAGPRPMTITATGRLTAVHVT